MTRILSFSLTDEEAAELGELGAAMKMGSRSEVVRAALANLRVEKKSLADAKGDTHAMILVVGNRHATDPRLHDLKHQFESSIMTSMHNVIHNQCIEMWLLHDDAKRIAELDTLLRKNRLLTTVKTIVF
ncbi:ribbon-helix-helix protein, CopG family [Candidatus Micrarchaeota archaeon]|nr:ribbon-helix-helix protein, CopG family [Candidatus Micrarchaeota archaeon]